MMPSPDPTAGDPEPPRRDGARASERATPPPIADPMREELARATHDVNNALNTVLVASHMLQLTAADPDAVRRHADRIAQAARQGVAAAARLVE